MKRLTNVVLFLRQIALCSLILLVSFSARSQEWLPVAQEAKPYTRWWWLGSAVDSAGLDYNLSEFAKAGIGGVEITPIYGVQDNDANDIDYLSPRWMQMLKYVEERGEQLGIEINMATGTGWPFGGPLVAAEDAACKLIFDEESNATVGRTAQKVKRAAPGGEGFVIDHFDKGAVARYLARFDSVFSYYQAAFPHTMFNDSYEVYGADWTPKMYEEFEQRRGYDLRPFTHVLNKKDEQRTEADKRIISDYRETLGELLLENFTSHWTEWAHSHGSITRNQAHGSPANLLDIYAAVDIPECEGFGLSDFGISGLRKDPGHTKKNDSDISMLKYASSAAHISGKKHISSETFTWLTEHFRTSLSQCKPDLDLMFISGVNHVFFHGSCYSPKDEPWPGWRFYASVDMTPYNPQWNAMPAFSRYIERCQSFLQWGSPDNDFLVYLPYYDMIYDQPGTVALFDIHSMEKRAPKFIETIQTIIQSGYDVDYISDRYLLTDTYRRYEAVIVPDVRFMPVATVNRLQSIAAAGKRVIFVGHYPESAPGYGRLTSEKTQFDNALETLKENSFLADDYAEALLLAGGRPEPMRTEYNLSCIRRSNPDGHHYFISNLTPNDIDALIPLGVNDPEALFYNPMTGDITHPKLQDGKVRIQLSSGESILLRTYADSRHPSVAKVSQHSYRGAVLQDLQLLQWELTFPEDIKMNADNNDTDSPQNFTATRIPMQSPQPWTQLGGSYSKVMATGCYTATFESKRNKAFDDCRHILDLGDVRESARVVLNGKEIATLFAVPFRCDLTPHIKKGKNTLQVYVTNLPANRIAQMDRDGVEWRKFKEINVVDLNYKKTLYDTWEPMPSGLNSEVRIISYAAE